MITTTVNVYNIYPNQPRAEDCSNKQFHRMALCTVSEGRFFGQRFFFLIVLFYFLKFFVVVVFELRS